MTESLSHTGQVEPNSIPTDPFAHPDDERPLDGTQQLDDTPDHRPKPGGSILMAGMIGLANGLGMEDRREDTEIAIPFDSDSEGLDINFGDLPPL